MIEKVLKYQVKKKIKYKEYPDLGYTLVIRSKNDYFIVPYDVFKKASSKTKLESRFIKNTYLFITKDYLKRYKKGEWWRINNVEDFESVEACEKLLDSGDISRLYDCRECWSSSYLRDVSGNLVKRPTALIAYLKNDFGSKDHLKAIKKLKAMPGVSKLKHQDLGYWQETDYRGAYSFLYLPDDSVFIAAKAAGKKWTDVMREACETQFWKMFRDKGLFIMK